MSKTLLRQLLENPQHGRARGDLGRRAGTDDALHRDPSVPASAEQVALRGGDGDPGSRYLDCQGWSFGLEAMSAFPYVRPWGAARRFALC
jgi:hypothetical protein